MKYKPGDQIILIGKYWYGTTFYGRVCTILDGRPTLLGLWNCEFEPIPIDWDHHIPGSNTIFLTEDEMIEANPLTLELFMGQLNHG